MAGEISNLAALTSWATGDLFEVVDVSDTSMAAAGTNKKMTLGDLFGGTTAIPVAVHFGGNVGIGVSPATDLHIESASNPTIRLRDTNNNASSNFELQNISDSQSSLTVTNAITNGNQLLDLDVAGNGTGNSQFRFNRSTNVSGTVTVQFMRGDNTTTKDHELISGASGTLADFCRNGGDAAFGGAIDGSSGFFKCYLRTDANRGTAAAAGAGAMIFNTDDGFPNWSDGTNWVDATGATT